MSAPPKSTPRDAQVMAAILKDMGVNEYEPRLINQMLEFTYRYVTDILDDAKVYSAHANKKNIDVEDVKLAIQCRLDHAFTTPPPRDLLMDVARHKNTAPLPLIKPYTGPKLPPDRYCLSASNYRLKTLKRPRVQLSGSGSGIATSLVNTPRFSIHGARPVVNAPALTLVTRPVTQPTVTIRTTPAPPPAARPIIRLTPGSTLSQPTSLVTTQISAPPSTIPTVVMDTNSLKRKREDDDDYDQP